MKIGYFTETFYPQKDGVVTAIEEAGKLLTKWGHEVHVFCPKSSVKEYMGMQIHSCRGITFKPYPAYKIGVPVNMKVPKLDIVHTHGPFSMGWFGLWIAKKQKIPKISTYHTLIPENASYISKKFKKPLRSIAEGYVKLHYNKYDYVITTNETMKKHLKIKTPIKVIPLGVNTEFYKPIPDAKQKLGLSGTVFLYLGRVSMDKSVNILIEAAKDFPEKSKLIIAGKGPELEKLRKKVIDNKLDGKVKFLGFIPDEQKPLYYSAADAFVTASKIETYGIVLQEAMACGCPCIAADYMATGETVKDGYNGYLFEADNVSQLADIVNRFKPTQQMKENALKTAQNFEIQKCTKQLEDFYKSLVR